MKVVFVTNYYNHHQSELAKALDRITGGSYLFVATSDIPEERKKMGYGYEDVPEFVRFANESEEEYQKCKQEILKAEAVIVGSAPRDIYYDRLKAGKLTFFYSERIYKEKKQFWKQPVRLVKMHHRMGRFHNTYLLAASAYAPCDYKNLGLFKKRAFKFGYFPPLKVIENPEKFIAEKEPNSILWVGRLLYWKHPEAALFLAKQLREKQYQAKIRIIGDGEMREELAKRICEEKLEDYVELLGVRTPKEVRDYMEKSQIYLFTSDYQEGWGAVLNESMNSAMGVVASLAAGSTPYLIHHTDAENSDANGYTFENEDWTGLTDKVCELLDRQDDLRRMGMNAYRTIQTQWNSQVAAERFVNICEHLLTARDGAEKEAVMRIYADGPLSMAPIMKDGKR